MRIVLPMMVAVLVVPAAVGGCNPVMFPDAATSSGSNSGSDPGATDGDASTDGAGSAGTTGGGGSDAPNSESDTGDASGGSTGEAPGSATGSPDDGFVDEGLPCEIRDVLYDYCGDCHGAIPQNGAVHSLLQRSDLLADSTSSPGEMMAEVALQRFSGAGERMPPQPHWQVLDARVEHWAAWVADGMPAGDCMPPASTDPYEDPNPGCISGQTWTAGLEEGSSEMDPGQACIDCHVTENEGPNYRFAGTVFHTGHEPDDCFGIDGGEQNTIVVFKDADGDTFTTEINTAGNFMVEPGELPAGFDPPWNVKVVAGDRELFMDAAFEDGDCNRCHSVAGIEDAPGRVIGPY